MAESGLKILGVIGARSGSKGIPDKNIKMLSGKPLMGWIIEAAKKSQYINRLIVSTDSSKYAEIARSLGAETPFLRPPEISGDKATDFQYIEQALQWFLKNENYVPDMVVRMMPTVPLQRTEDIDACIGNLIDDAEAHASVVVAEASQHPHKAMKLMNEGGRDYIVSYITSKARDAEPAFRQGYDKAYFRANVIATRSKVVREMKSLVGEKIRAHIIPRERAVDIDAPVDFFIAEKLIEYFTNRSEK